MDILLKYAFSFLGVHYQWGGNNRLEGMDCSAFVNEILRSAGLVKNSEDLTAQMLYDRFERDGTVNKYQPGSLAFYGESVTKITHVALLINQYQIIESGGAGSNSKSFEDAKRLGAMVRIRHINNRSDLVAVIGPRYNTIGLI